MKFEKGDLVRFKRNEKFPHPLDNVLGLILSNGEERSRLYGDGACIDVFIDVLWFDDMSSTRYRSPHGRFEIVSKGA